MSVFSWPPISVTTSAPVGGATEAKQDAQIVQETAINTALGAQADAVATTDTGTFSIIAFIKRSMQNWTSLLAKLPTLVSGRIPVDGSGITQPVSGPLTDTQLRASAVPVTANAGTNLNTSALALETTQTANGVLMGAVAETAPVSDTASSGLNGRLQRVAQRLTSLIALFPTSLGSKADAASLAVTQSTEDKAIQGALTETAPASDTASSGLNGRLQRIAQRITSLIALFPTALGQGTMATSFKVVLPSDQSAISVTQTTLTTSFQEILTLTNTAQTFTAPANAKWCKLYADDTNTANIRVKIGGTVTVSSGLQLQPGRAEDFFSAGNVSVICETSATSQKICAHFGV